MLPKITDKSGFKKLHMAYSLPNTIRINKLSDHWETFKHIVQSKNFTQNWQSTILFFGRKWLDNKNNSKEWSKFKDYLFHIIWDHANYAIDKVKFNVNWESFAEAISLRRLQPKPYLIDQMRHLLSVVAGNFPAFAVMDNSQEAAPTDLLQNIFVESYGLKQYLPTLMYACMPQNGATKPRYVYYSLSMPTVLEGSPLKKTTSTIVSDLREIKLLIETLKNHHAFKANKIIQNTVIDYFHYEKDMCGQVKTSDSIPIEDDSFLKDQNIFPSRNFCATSPFFSGCIRIKV
jgi:hypothetical protein